jgi:hypothetical protein
MVNQRSAEKLTLQVAFVIVEQGFDYGWQKSRVKAVVAAIRCPRTRRPLAAFVLHGSWSFCIGLWNRGQ